MTYAANTSVPVSKSRAEIEKVVTKYGATRFAPLSEPDRAHAVIAKARGWI